ncbi:MAG: hypothetical protein BGO29_06380 [Bacteroidales bacterium 36-12]|jgi:ATP-binding cassette subfamily B protein|nr:MAG: hypothetical protein BGO29_06380 [Bacteroidales bacterium 36-12]
MSIQLFPHEFQLDARNCGPACLKIIAQYYGKDYPLQYLQDLCGMTKDGVSLMDISHAAEKIGLRTIAIQITLKDLVDKVTLPAIAHWNNDHFIVVYHITENKVMVSDPAIGHIDYTHREFVDKWYKDDGKYGILMALEPMSNFGSF